MKNPTPAKLAEAIKFIQSEDFDFNILTPENGEAYEKACGIYNARIKKRPACIGFCEKAEHVQACFFIATRFGLSVTVRSGGHNHEGTCMNNYGVVIDVSLMQTVNIQCDPDNYSSNDYAEFGPGCRLGEVVPMLVAKKRIIPVGGCKKVRVGGLTQGGGWGAAYRHLGATSDWLEEVDIVIPNGQKLTLNVKGKTDDNEGELPPNVMDNGKSLFWAIRGGGGGNFGVVTRFKFRLAERAHDVRTISYKFHRKHRDEVIRRFNELMARENNGKLTLACRLTVVEDDFDLDNPAVIVVGNYFGGYEDAKASIDYLFDKSWEENTDYVGEIEPTMSRPLESRSLEDKLVEAYLYSPASFQLNAEDRNRPAQSDGLNVGALSLTERIYTCDFDNLPEPHQVSSAFTNDISSLTTFLSKYLLKKDQETKLPGRVNYYLTLHGLGGKLPFEPEDTAFPWRDEKVMLQIQAWWIPDANVDLNIYVEWVRKFRRDLSVVARGGFINFPDKTIPLKEYYNGLYPALRDVKKLYDGSQVLNPEMGIEPG